MHPESHGVFHQLHLDLPAGHDSLHQRLGSGVTVPSVIPKNTYSVAIYVKITHRYIYIYTHTHKHTLPLTETTFASVGLSNQGAQKHTHTPFRHKAYGRGSRVPSSTLFPGFFHLLLILFPFQQNCMIFYQIVFLLVGEMSLFLSFYKRSSGVQNSIYFQREFAKRQQTALDKPSS